MKKHLLYAFAGVAFCGSTSAATIGFDISLNYINAPTPSQAAAFSAAEGLWESIITGFEDTLVDITIEIDVELTAIDGPGGTLGSAGPTTGKTGLEANFLYAGSGSMTFDTADTDGLEASGVFDDVILHEMGHVLGIGTLWSSSGVGLPGFQELYVNNSGEYTGAFGLAAYNDEFNQSGSFVPVELGGGGGTANGHWNEVDGGAGPTGIVSKYTGQDFQEELMTGWLNSSPFISRLTSESMRDLGYTVAATPIPEPSILLFSFAGIGFLFRRSR